jgi:nitrogen fixation protein NifX
MALERRLRLVTAQEEKGKMDAAVKVAFATSDMKRVDQHFGAARSFAVYALSAEHARLKEVVAFGEQSLDDRPGRGARSGPVGGPMIGGETTGPDVDPPEAPGMHVRSQGRSERGLRGDASGRHEDRLSAKIEALDGCIAVYCQAVGASAIKQLRTKGIHAVKVPWGSEIRDLIETLQQELEAGPSAWLARAIAQNVPRDPSRFDSMEQEGWVE